jgi:four helix bundle protein
MTGARHYKELIVWQLGDQLRVETFKLTRRPPFARDFKHQSQAEDAVDSVCRNIAEGLVCDHIEFARFLEISRRSLNELMDSLRSALLKGYVSPVDLAPIHGLARREFPAIGKLIAYLRRTGNRRPNRTDKRQRSTDPRERDRTDPRQRDRTDQR